MQVPIGSATVRTGTKWAAATFRDTHQRMQYQPPGEELLRYFIQQGAAWIRSQREALRPVGVRLDPQVVPLFSIYFGAETVDSVRLCYLPGAIPNPTFYAELARQGIPEPLDFTQMDGLTYSDTVAIARRNYDPAGLLALVFHECVHVAQYRRLGIDRFMEQYVRGWAQNGFSYHAIPLENQAYKFQERLIAGERFSVEDELALQAA